MARARIDEEREVSIADAAMWLAMTQQGVGQWADQAPAEYVRIKGRKRLLVWPGFMVWYRQRLTESRSKPSEFEERRTKKIEVEAAMLELQLAKAKNELVPVPAARQAWRQGLARIRAQLLAVPGRYSPRTVGLGSLPESQRAWDHAIRDILSELQEGDPA